MEQNRIDREIQNEASIQVEADQKREIEIRQRPIRTHSDVEMHAEAVRDQIAIDLSEVKEQISETEVDDGDDPWNTPDALCSDLFDHGHGAGLHADPAGDGGQ